MHLTAAPNIHSQHMASASAVQRLAVLRGCRAAASLVTVTRRGGGGRRRGGRFIEPISVLHVTPECTEV